MPVAVTRRTLLSAAAACTTASFAVAQPALGPRPRAGEVRAGAGGTKVVLLGTKGGPRVNKGRANPSNLVIAAGRSYVVDCGYGVTRQLVAAGVEAQEVRTILITHNHSDHMLEVGPLIYNAWAGGLTEPIEVRGPPPIGKIVTNFLESVGYDIDIRMEDEGRPDLRKFVRVHEFEAPPLGAGAATAFERDGLRVSAVRVRHPPITHAYAYRFDAPDRSIVLSGDTTYSPELVALAKGADVLVHEAMHLAGLDRLLSRNPNAPTLRKHLVESHTTTEQLGHVAAEAGVKTLVLSHLVPGDDPSITAAMWTEDVRKNFSGEIVIGRDLMTI
ncbi:MAG TPA: MBL fold metallo-hydrolase [Xanthobacteraceae bacterium]|jgi:ribonuclease BN (tRNA processing enzyme)|nr:MBL fold metallo-hydrolase [Xanthobacteraceae bacterium]